ncbi:MAG TPA: methyltransferase domain-containing protein [Acidimicrobiia bacterium]|nr:methyltransferase domain-containing protein [Acidimicrobiia bacterium]
MPSAYAFGDSDLARERLALVADTFVDPTRALLQSLPPGDRRYVVDLGCGPGHTTALLREAFPHSFVTGVDASEAMVAEARTRVPTAEFFIGDVTAALAIPAHVVYARLLLGHLADQRSALTQWAAPLRAGGVLVCEEPVRYRSDDTLYRRYERAVTDVVAARGGTLWASAALDHDPPQMQRVHDTVVEHCVEDARVAAMFWRNAVSWGGEDDLVDALRAREAAPLDAPVIWEIRQVVWVKNPE